MLTTVASVKRNALGIFQNIDLNSLVAQQLFVARCTGDIAYHHARKSAHVEQCCADIAGAERSEQGGSAEVNPSGIANRCGLAVVVGMVFLNQGVVTFTDNASTVVINDDRPDWATALIKAFLCQQNRDAHEVGVV